MVFVVAIFEVVVGLGVSADLYYCTVSVCSYYSETYLTAFLDFVAATSVKVRLFMLLYVTLCYVTLR
jgi:hypothetical protein